MWTKILASVFDSFNLDGTTHGSFPTFFADADSSIKTIKDG